VAWSGTLAAGAVLATLVGLLLADYAWRLRQWPALQKRLDELEQAARESIDSVPALDAERDRIKRELLGRKRRDQQIGWYTLAAAAAFLTFGKWLLGLYGEPVPSERQIERHRSERPVTERLIELPRRLARRPVRPSGAAATAACACNGNGRPRTIITPETDDVEAAVRQIIAETGSGPEAAIAILQRLQDRYRYLPQEALSKVCELTEISPAQLLGVATFYAQFRHEPVGLYLVRVCHGTACHVAGAPRISDELRRHLNIPDGSDTDPDRLFTLERVACLGCCSLAPVMMVDGRTFGRLDPQRACEALEQYRQTAAVS